MILGFKKSLEKAMCTQGKVALISYDRVGPYTVQTQNVQETFEQVKEQILQ